MMGATTSIAEENDSRWHVDSTSVYETDSWVLYAGTYGDEVDVSVFRSKNGQINANSLECSAKFLQTLRHPYLMRHIHSKRIHDDNFCLITESVAPLETLLQKQKIKMVEIVSGLYNILQALGFLHNKCKIRHKNISISSVFISTDGNWKLGGFEISEKYSARNKSQKNYKLEEEGLISSKDILHAEDIIAFGKLALHLLGQEPTENPVVINFKKRIQEECLDSEMAKIPESTSLQTDEFFRNEFLEIKRFLQTLVLKAPEEKEHFFHCLPEILSTLDVSILARQILPLLMSRIVFLNPSANKYVLPLLLRPKSDYNPHCLFPSDLFKDLVIPWLKKIFQVHDCSIRMQLLENFSHFAYFFSEQDLQNSVLPEVLLGIRDVNDDLVAASLKALAILVKILGAKVVIGHNSQHIFTENGPGKLYLQEKKQISLPPDFFTESVNSTLQNKNVLPKSDLKCTNLDRFNRKNELSVYCSLPPIPERSSPDGGESIEKETWSDWDEDVDGESVANSTRPSPLNSCEEMEHIDNIIENSHQSKKLSLNQPPRLGEEFDIMPLNIKSVELSSNEEDYFADMQPKIMLPKPCGFVIKNIKELKHHRSSKFSVPLDIEDEECSGWDDTELEVEW